MGTALDSLQKCFQNWILKILKTVLFMLFWIDLNFTNSIKVVETSAWIEFVKVITNFYGNKKLSDYPQQIEQLKLCIQIIGDSINIKLHFLVGH